MKVIWTAVSRNNIGQPAKAVFYVISDDTFKSKMIGEFIPVGTDEEMSEMCVLLAVQMER